MYQIKIDPKLCNGCLLCVYICNKRGGKVLNKSEAEALLGGFLPEFREGCIGCRWCERLCPDFAIVVEEVKN